MWGVVVLTSSGCVGELVGSVCVLCLVVELLWGSIVFCDGVDVFVF